MGYLSKRELSRLNFVSLGNGVLISERASLHKTELMSIGDNSRIDDFCAVSGNVHIGRNVHISVHCSITASSEWAVFEDFSGLAMGCHVFTSSDDYSGNSMTNPTVPIEYRNPKHGAVKLGRHVIVGANAVVFPGVSIAEGCSIGAFSMVNKSTEPWGVYVGVPAKRVRERSKGLLVFERKYLDSES
jgi:galactoside O-acetyltransferase